MEGSARSTEHSQQKPIEKRSSKTIVSRTGQLSMRKSYQVCGEDFRGRWFEKIGARMKILSPSACGNRLGFGVRAFAQRLGWRKLRH